MCVWGGGEGGVKLLTLSVNHTHTTGMQALCAQVLGMQPATSHAPLHPITP
jgi:hypothetical protein